MAGQKFYKLNSGFEIPAVGYGTYETPPDVTERVVAAALKNGYRHIDTAAFYNNESGCGAAIKSSGIPRSDIFFVTKVAPQAMGYDATKAAIESSLKEAGLSYIDLYLIHAAFGDTEARNGSWKALVEAVEAGKIRSIGVSNYGLHHFKELEDFRATSPSLSKVPISVGQYELHPWMLREEIVAYAQKNGIILQAFGPLALGKQAENPVVVDIAKKHGKSWSQVLLRWSLQKGFAPLPKSVTESRIADNIKVFDFELDDSEVKALEIGGYQLNRAHWDPVTWGLTGPGSKA